MEEIKIFLAKKRLNFDIAIMLYMKYNKTAIMQKQARRFQQKTPIMAALVIYELEKLAGLPESGRLAEDFEESEQSDEPNEDTDQNDEPNADDEPNDEPDDDSFGLFDDVFGQKRIEDMSDSERSLVIRKKQLNNRLTENRTDLLATGEGNSDPNVLAQRAGYIAEMKGQSEQIKEIHATLNPAPEVEITTEEITREIAKIEKKQAKIQKTKDKPTQRKKK